MTYRELLLQAELKLDHNDITLGEFEQMIAPLNREVDLLDKIRAEIDRKAIYYETEVNTNIASGMRKAIEIIDKYRADKEEE